VPSCFGASPSDDAMYFAGRVVSLTISLVDAPLSMSFVIEVGSLMADDRFSPGDEFWWSCVADERSGVDYVYERIS